MIGQRIGYRRVSTVDQNLGRQLDGVAVDQSFEDKISGKNTDRAQLQAALHYCRKGDTLVCHSMDRLARNLIDLCTIVKDLTSRGVAVEFHKENLTFSGNDSPMATLQLQMMGAFAQFERALLLERQREGIHLAKIAGKYRGRKRALSNDQAAELRRRALAGESKTDLAVAYAVSRETVYSYLERA
jgi:DNA invertase Pin-like site-specific DNA recombinase